MKIMIEFETLFPLTLEEMAILALMLLFTGGAIYLILWVLWDEKKRRNEKDGFAYKLPTNTR